jgi:hypothetical protein
MDRLLAILVLVNLSVVPGVHNDFRFPANFTGVNAEAALLLDYAGLAVQTIISTSGIC